MPRLMKPKPKPEDHEEDCRCLTTGDVADCCCKKKEGEDTETPAAEE